MQTNTSIKNCLVYQNTWLANIWLQRSIFEDRWNMKPLLRRTPFPDDGCLKSHIMLCSQTNHYESWTVLWNVIYQGIEERTHLNRLVHPIAYERIADLLEVPIDRIYI